MAPRPLSWVRSYDYADSDVSFNPYSGRSSPQERQHMLAESSTAAPTRHPSEASSSSPGASSSSHSHSQPRPSYSRSLSPTDAPDHHPAHDTAPAEPLPSFLRMPRSASFASSPLNPSSPASPAHPAAPFTSPFARPGSRGSAHINRIASEESRALSMALPASFALSSPSPPGARASMILYRRADPAEALRPPTMPGAHPHRSSVASTSGDSFVSLSSDSKYPFAAGAGAGPGGLAPERGLVAYAYDPALDDDDDDDDDEDPAGEKGGPGSAKAGERAGWVADWGKGGRKRSWRGFKNLAALGLLVAALLVLFVVYPIIDAFRGYRVEQLIVLNTRINATGQAEAVSFDTRRRREEGQTQVPIPVELPIVDPIPNDAVVDAIDQETPEEGRRWVDGEGEVYELMFSDEFGVEGRTFFEGADPKWEAVDHASYDPRQITTKDGHLVLTPSPSSQRHQNQDPDQDQDQDHNHNHNRPQNRTTDPMLRLRAPLCLALRSKSGFVEAAARIAVPGPRGAWRRSRRRAYWSGAAVWSTLGGNGEGGGEAPPAPVPQRGTRSADRPGSGSGTGSGDRPPGGTRLDMRIGLPGGYGRAPGVVRIEYIRVFGRVGEAGGGEGEGGREAGGAACDGRGLYQQANVLLDWF